MGLLDALVAARALPGEKRRFGASAAERRSRATIVGMTDVPTQAHDAADPLQAGREALGRRAWQEAFDRLSEADRAGALSGSDLEALAETAFFTAHADVGIEVKERAFKARLAEGDKIRAAYLAFDLGREYEYTGKPSIASGWIRRGEGLLEGEPESYANGYLEFYRSDHARASGDMDAALAHAEAAVEIAQRTANADLGAFARTSLGSIKIAGGSTIEGFNLMEEASLAAVNGELSPIAAGVACCSMISACRDITDYARAGEWLEATEKYCQRQSVGAFPGVCRVHRAELKAMSGAWENAEAELRQATTELAAYNAIPPMADGIYAMADIRRLRGDLEGAEEALREAHGYGRSLQPALALIRLAEGKIKAASTGINTAVVEQANDRWGRARLLPAQAEIAIAARDLTLAREAADELDRHVAELPVACPGSGQAPDPRPGPVGRGRSGVGRGRAQDRHQVLASGRQPVRDRPDASTPGRRAARAGR